MESKNVRCKVCFSCKTYVVIHNNNPISQMILNLFEKFHSGEPTQTVNLSEIPKDYICADIKIGKEREETLLEIQEMLAKEKIQNYKYYDN